MFLLSNFSCTVFSCEYEYMQLMDFPITLEKANSQIKVTCFRY